MTRSRTYPTPGYHTATGEPSPWVSLRPPTSWAGNDGVSVLIQAVRRGCETAETRAARKLWEVEDGLWARIEPLLPVVARRYRHPGRKRLDDRKVLCGILFVLCTGIRWEFLP